MIRRIATSTAALSIVGTAAFVGAQGTGALPACTPGNGGLTLPAGFCAVVVAENVGTGRHLTVAANGDIYLALRNTQNAKGAIVALRDTNGDGRADVRERIGAEGGTGIALHNGYLYFAENDSRIVRYRMTPGQLLPSGPRELIATMPEQRSHAGKGLAFDGKGGVYVNIGAPSNACQADDRKEGVPGQKPCPLLDPYGTIWRFDANRTGQTLTDGGRRYATGFRQMLAVAWHDGSLYLVQHGRDQLDTLWPKFFNQQQNAELPAEEFLRVTEGGTYAWPYCYYDWQQNRHVLMPEYGGDGKMVGDCAKYPAPLVGFPGHWAPNALHFYTGAQFPEKYRGGAFIAFHGSWNRAPLPQAGYRIAFVPFRAGKVTGQWETFADGFAGKTPLARPEDAVTRPTGLAQGPDGSLYISDTEKGTIWRVVYRGGAGTR